MKKKTFLILGFLLLTVAIFAQDTINVIHNQGESILDFLKGNWKGLALLVLLFVSEWMGESESIPEGSIWKKIVNWALMFVRSKKKLKSKKAKYLKVLILGLLISGIGMSASAQTKNKLFTPVTYAQLINAQGVRGIDKVADGAFILRFQATLAATVSKYDSETKKVVSTPLSRIGGGLSYAHYIPVDGVPVNNYSFNALVLIPTDAITNVGAALTVSIFNVNVGVLYDFVKDSPFKDNIGLLTGVSLTF